MTVTARWNGETIAESDDTVVVEGNHYFPVDDVRGDMLMPSDTTSHCPWKGEAGYYSIRAGEEVNTDAAWYYADPKEEAAGIKDILTKSLGTANPQNVVKATMAGLADLRNPSDVARRRGKEVDEVTG